MFFTHAVFQPSTSGLFAKQPGKRQGARAAGRTLQAAVGVLARQHAPCADEVDVEHPGGSTLSCQAACCDTAAKQQARPCMDRQASLASKVVRATAEGILFARALPALCSAVRATMHMRFLPR